MDFETHIEEQLSEEQKKETIFNKTEDCIKEGEQEMEMLPEDKRKVVEVITHKKFEPLSADIIDKLAGVLRMDMPEK